MAVIAPTARTVVLVEGESDREAVLRARRAARGRPRRDGVAVLAMGGVTNVARYVAELGPPGRGLRLAGLYDAGEERFVRGGLERAGLAPGPGRAGLAALGFHCCERDLEDELIRALGVDRVLAVVDGAARARLVPGAAAAARPAGPAYRGPPAPVPRRRARAARSATAGCWSRRSTRRRAGAAGRAARRRACVIRRGRGGTIRA